MNVKLLRQVMFLCMLAGAAGMAFAQITPASQKPVVKDLFMKDDARCTTCHDEADDPRMLHIGKTRHGVTADKRGPTCVSCHGFSEEHVLNSKKLKDRPKPDLTFGGQLLTVPADNRVDVFFGQQGKKTDTPVVDRNKACLTCHQGGNRIGWQSSTHANRDVACTSCHKIHNPAGDEVRNKTVQTELCYTCHKEQRTQFNKPSHHPVTEGKMACSSCHNVHGDNPKQLIKSSTNDTCYTCHMEKRGPFVHNHQPVAEDCGICHQPHGTTVPNLLKSRAPFLCQECHSTTTSTHRGQAAGLPTGMTTSASLTGTVGRGCLNCHTNIHGGNSAVNSATAGRFRR
ncbi:MAG: DmsE family decaheme c-type cytochrome [Rhodocyclaceae bacterium]|nr:DmsE family decaheme c-type cytochrome [Rhodocyclaceae bacterium]